MLQKTTLTVLVVDDHPLLRKGVVDLLELEDHIVPVGEASNGQQALELALQLEPDLILLDLNMPNMDGIETIRALRDAGVDSRILLFTVSDNEQDVVSAFREGADGYLLKDLEPESLVQNIVKAAEGKTAISPELVNILTTAIRSRSSQPDSTLSDLTDREQEVLKYVAHGLSNKMIARELDIAEGTVKVHVKRLLKKLGMRSRVEAAVWLTRLQE
ncbi:MAG: two-component system response regulator NarL [Pseudomonadales bacterium]|nr:two-component system response regulator NarL [Pseudomonadales bacterium]